MPVTHSLPSEKEIKKTSPFILTSKTVKYVGINLKGSERLVHWKLLNIANRSKEMLVNGEVYLVYGLEDSTLLRCHLSPS